jgi:hypothetical protein
MCPKKSGKVSPAEQSARFREAAEKADADSARAFERAFKKIVPVKKPEKKR